VKGDIIERVVAVMRVVFGKKRTWSIHDPSLKVDSNEREYGENGRVG